VHVSYNLIRPTALVACAIIVLTMQAEATSITSEKSQSKRVPAEWEAQEAIWLQWPGRYEKSYEPAFAEISKIVAGYQKLHVL